MPLELPARISKYELERFLGGGMSHVYRATDTVIGRTVAVKILTEQGCVDEDTRTRFLLEARLAGGLDHENIITIHDFGEDDQKRPFMVMEFLRGEDLRQVIRSGKNNDIPSKLNIAVQVARALRYIHEKQIIHRDIKPENIHVTPTGKVKLMDFGIAKTEGLSMTQAGFVMGTPYYMSPEQVRGQEIDDGVDIYAFGILLFELFSGKKPFTGETIDRVFYSILNEPLDLKVLKDTGVPDDACQLVARCTEKERKARPADFSVVIKDLENLINTHGSPDAATSETAETTVATTARPEEVEEVESGANRKLMIAAIAVILCAAVAVGYLVLSKKAKPKEPVASTAQPAIPQLPSRLALPTGDMVLVPAGSFLYGKERTPTVIPAFYVDLTEVSNSAYEAFCKATGHPLPGNFPKDKADYPIVDINIGEAKQFAAWAGKRLPTSQEWEKAARGTDGRTFPWGEEADASRANLRDNSQLARHSLMPVRSFASFGSPFQALQMVGNVWEFIDEAVVPSPGVVERFAVTLKPPPAQNEKWFMIRGESYSEPLAKEVLYDSSTIPERWKDPTAGFRCVKDPSQNQR
jgi:eukaryotic-like serine/threonine-protein kinase